jgi:hypothetical protein
MMNIIKIDNQIYRYEFFWRNSKNDHTLDYKGNLFPWPIDSSIIWNFKNSFLEKITEVETKLKHKFMKYKKDEFKDCLLCDKKKITTGIFSINGIRWENGLKHYVKIHNNRPSNEFTDFIFRFGNEERKSHIITKIKGVSVIKSNKKRYLKVSRNQLLIMDALMKHGGYKIYKDKYENNIYRYSEHAGLLDFDNSGLERIIISGNTTRIDEGDDDIFLPKNMIDAFDYEYIFHTHPPTPKPGGRAKLGIIYEFPSISDIFHFMEHYNDGRTQGSIVIAPEGLYIIRKKDSSNQKKIKINEDKFYKEATKIIWKVHEESIKRYGTDFSISTFYSKIAQDLSPINEINTVLNKFGIHIDYYSRIKDIKNQWVIDTLYLPVYVIEPKL